ncbi:MAG: metallophosphoesterase [Chloroflexi bacterium]|nr:metallophosphoesterase [Chloroflexota bacterium]
MVRLLHTSDLHLGEEGPVRNHRSGPGQETIRRLVHWAKDMEADILVIAGDLFDNNRVDASMAESAMQLLAGGRFPVVLLPGNHDCLSPDSVYHRIARAKYCPPVKILTASGGETVSFPALDMAVWGKPVDSYSGDQCPMAGIPPRGPERWQVAVAHGHYVGNSDGEINALQISEKEIAWSGRDYVALGHWGSFQCVSNRPVKACYSGSASHTGTAVLVDFLDAGEVRVQSQSFIGEG